MATEYQQMLGKLGELTDAYHGKAADIDARLNAVASRWDDFETIWRVDQANGNDANPGTIAAPLATIQEAIDRTPFGGRASIRVHGTYTTTMRLRPFGRHVTLIGVDAAGNFGPVNMHLGYEVTGGVLTTFGFDCECESSWDLYYINLKARTAAEVLAASPGATWATAAAAIFGRVSSKGLIPGSVFLRYCSVDITADPYVTLLSTGTWRLELFSTSLPNPLAGRFLPGVAAGTAAASLPNLLTTIQSL